MAIHPTAPQVTDELSAVLAKLTQSSAENLALCDRNRQLQAENDWFRERFRLGVHRQFGPSSETTPATLQLLFNEAEAHAEPSAPEPTLKQVLRGVRKTKGKRERQYDNLDIEVVPHELPEEQRRCRCCHGAMHQMGCQVTREIKIIPQRAVQLEHRWFSYACRHCAKRGAGASIVTAPKPPRCFSGSPASPSLVAYIISQKYEMASPLYRLEPHFAAMGLELPRQNQANWVMRGADVLAPLHNLLHRTLVQRDIAHADETTLQVLREDGREATEKSYIWSYCSGQSGPPVMLYEYSTTRAYEHPRQFLQGFQGYLHADGYQAYDNMPQVTVVGCLAHARRNFVDALRALPKPDQSKITPASQGVEFCNRLYRIERKARELELSAEARFEFRLAHSAPVLEEFHTWLVAKSPGVGTKSKLAQAIGCCLNQWAKLNNFLLDGRLEIDNNRCERAVKPFVIGRKNWLFSNTPRGARASATLYSIVETAKANGLVPMKYLVHLFETMPTIAANDEAALAALLPWAPGVQARCAQKKPAKPP